ncbi:GAF domain-containing protein [Parasedimentitalea huanghaiensis]|uniref:GAF domain-containing protein n=1 Tax=Parasedimentitalea huanghaiensis TaxID=2682100 RepID=A0A6L6WCG5_9RHOB|nr:GAF domain-containing protein [Zongyanglinia huanghaiensis]MVO15533.1 GAF domain-containing protein [Zongyanglinia huanghaiensis]
MTKDAALAQFESALSAATTSDQAYAALSDLWQNVVGAKLFTVMTVDLETELAQRPYTNDPVNYPTSGTKPITRNSWFSVVHERHECFVANSIEEIAEVFPDYELINSLGCQSVVNLPIVIGGTLAATVNVLHEAGYYTEDRVQSAKDLLALPSLAALCVAQRLS